MRCPEWWLPFDLGECTVPLVPEKGQWLLQLVCALFGLVRTSSHCTCPAKPWGHQTTEQG